MEVDTGNALIVQSVVDLGHKLGPTTVAEGAGAGTLTGPTSHGRPPGG